MKNIKKILLSTIAASVCSLLIPMSAKAVPCYQQEMSVEQPDESEVKVVVTGDEFYQHVESTDGYTLVRNDEGWICYADLNEDGSDFVATNRIYNGQAPRSLDSSENSAPSNIEKHLTISKEGVNAKRAKNENDLLGDESNTKNDFVTESAYSARSRSTSNRDVKGLTVLVKFPDENVTISSSEIDDFFNKPGYNGYSNNGSIRDYFKDISNGNLDYSNKVVGYYTAKHNKSYYDGSNVTDYTKAKELITEVLDWVKDSDIDVSDVTMDSDDTYKMLNVLYAGETRSAWSTGLWPHKSAINYDGGTQIYELTNIGSQLSLGTICHENGHALLGYPDLYRYDNSVSIVGSYCLMGSGCYAGGSKNPTPPNPYLRNIVSGFGTNKSLNNVADSSTVTLNSLGTSNKDVYKWSNESNSDEYYLLENIGGTGRYADMPDKGLIIWKVNEDGSNRSPENSKYLVSVVQADNADELEKGINRGMPGDLFSTSTKVQFSDSKWFDGSNTGLKITNISAKGTTMTFTKGGQQKSGWVQVGDSWYYYNADGTVKTGWLQDNGEWYYFDANGVMKTDWVEVDGNWYYLNPVSDGTRGAMKTGWVKVDGKWYYLNPVSDGTRGAMKTGWVQVDGKWYYLNPVSDGTRGAMKTGWLNDNGTWYYLDDNTGAMLTNTTTPDGYYVNGDGVWVH